MSNLRFETNLEDLKSPNFDIYLWFSHLDSLADYVIFADYAYRIVYCLHLFVKYWNPGATAVPEIDIRVFKATRNPFKMTPYRAAIHIIAPLTGFIITSLVIIGTLSILTALYLPIYDDYVSGCVELSSNGTILATNLFSIAYNHASKDGNEMMLKERDSFDNERTSICSNAIARSVEQQQQDVYYLDSFIDLHNTSATNMQLLKNCLNVEEFDAWFNHACCDKKGYKRCGKSKYQRHNYSCPSNDLVSPASYFQAPRKYINEKSCSESIFRNNSEWNIHNALFNCDVMASCHITCNGPHRHKLKYTTKVCSCQIEWLSHSLWLKSFLTTLVYILINFSRVILLSGLHRCMWKKLHPSIFTILSNCRAGTGSIISSKDTNLLKSLSRSKDLVDSNDEVSLKEDKEDRKHGIQYVIKKNIDKIFFQFVLTGYMMILFSLLINAIWITGLIKLSHSIEPKWEAS